MRQRIIFHSKKFILQFALREVQFISVLVNQNEILGEAEKQQCFAVHDECKKKVLCYISREQTKSTYRNWSSWTVLTAVLNRVTGVSCPRWAINSSVRTHGCRHLVVKLLKKLENYRLWTTVSRKNEIRPYTPISQPPTADRNLRRVVTLSAIICNIGKCAILYIRRVFRGMVVDVLQFSHFEEIKSFSVLSTSFRDPAAVSWTSILT